MLAQLCSWHPLTIVIMYLVAANSFASSPKDASPVVSSLYNLHKWLDRNQFCWSSTNKVCSCEEVCNCQGICLFVSLSVKAVHLEPVSDLTTDAFIASFRHFTSRGKPSLILSADGINFTGANREEIYEFFNKRKTQGDIFDLFSSMYGMEIHSQTCHTLHWIVGSSCEINEIPFQTIYWYYQADLKSLRPSSHRLNPALIAAPSSFISWRRQHWSSNSPFSNWKTIRIYFPLLLQSLPSEVLVSANLFTTFGNVGLMSISSLRKHKKWKFTSRNIRIGYIVVLQEDNLVTIGHKLIQVHPGKDGLVCVATVKMSSGVNNPLLNSLYSSLKIELWPAVCLCLH